MFIIYISMTWHRELFDIIVVRFYIMGTSDFNQKIIADTSV